MRIYRYLYTWWLKTKESTWVFANEIKRIFTDPGVTVIFIVATIAYPILYNCIYWKDNVENIPVAVVDLSCSSESRNFLHRWNACPEVRLDYTCASMAEAERLLRDQKVHGIIYFPTDFAKALNSGMETAHISLYCDMSSFLYMKGIYLSCNKVMLESMSSIQIDRYEAMGMDEEFAWSLVQASPYTETALFCPTGGYAAFLIPAVLMLILHQTLFFGICMLGGTAREENRELFRLPGARRGASVLRIVVGRASAYFLIYMALGVFALLAVPRMFGLPHIGSPWDVMRFYVPYLLATIFFSMLVSTFIRNRESGIVLLISTSLIFIFIAGVSWPQQMLPKPWLWLSYFFPYTWGVHGFLHINSMGATLAATSKEYIALWILAIGYFVLTCGMLAVLGWWSDRRGDNWRAKSSGLMMLLLLLALPAAADDTIPTRERELEQIEVIGDKSDFQMESLRLVSILSAEDIAGLPIRTVADVLQYMPGVDLRERGAGGVQADLSMRGGTAKQVKILLNGIDVTDPQTEHYSMDLPVDASLIERIELLQGTNYAIDAFSGAINIVTKSKGTPPGLDTPRPPLRGGEEEKTVVMGQLTAGEYGLVNPSLAVRAQKNEWYINSSASYNRSSGYAANTDYCIANAYVQTGYKDLDIQLGAQYKDAGANCFYSVKYPHQFDATRTALASVAYNHRWQSGWAIETHASYRAHYDRFELYRDGVDAEGQLAPDWYTPNIHWTHTAGIHTEGSWSNEWTKTSVGVDFRNEYIRSSNMGIHNRVNLRYFAEQRFYWRGLSASLGASGVWNSQFGHDWAVGMNIGYEPIKNLHLFVNANRAIRVPTFTDLYYQSATQQADPSTRPEKAWQVELSARYTAPHWYVSASGYYRWGRDIIDWVKPADPDIVQWRSVNNTLVNATGVEATVGVYGYEWLKRLEISYAFCDVQADAGQMMSLYVLDYLRHKATLSIEHKIYKGFGASWSLSVRQRQGEYTSLEGQIENYRPVCILDGSVYWRNDYLKISLDARNMADQLYYDFSGVIQPRHWVSASVGFTL